MGCPGGCLPIIGSSGSARGLERGADVDHGQHLGAVEEGGHLFSGGGAVPEGEQLPTVLVCAVPTSAVLGDSEEHRRVVDRLEGVAYRGMTIRSPLRPSQAVSPLVSRTCPRSTSRVASPGFSCSASDVPAVRARTVWRSVCSWPP